MATCSNGRYLNEVMIMSKTLVLIAVSMVVVADSCYGQEPREHSDSVVPATIPEEMRARVQRIMEALDTSAAEEFKAYLERRKENRGTEMFLKEGASEDHARVAARFWIDDPAPRQRLEVFDPILSNANVSSRGWFGGVSKVTRNGDVIAAEVTVQPLLVHKRGGVTFTPLSAVETWELKDNKLRFIDSRRSGGPAFLLAD